MGSTGKSKTKLVSDSVIFRNMMITVFGASSIFLLKNIISKTWSGAIIIGCCLIVFTLVVVLMKKLKVKQERQQLVICISIVFLVFCISINSGDFYSDDFPLYLGVIAVSGLFLVPHYTLMQAVLIDILLVVSYLLHPEKADPLSQYIMCIAMFSVAAIAFYMVIKRGRSYIEEGKLRAEEAERLLSELKNAGEELRRSCEDSADRNSELVQANEALFSSARVLKNGSESISKGTVELSQTFQSVKKRMDSTGEQMRSMNLEVKNVEDTLATNKEQMSAMTSEMEALKNAIQNTNEVFSSLHKEIIEIFGVTDQLSKIASNTTILALNASVEAARAGEHGAGFAVVASTVRGLAADSNQYASDVVSIVNSMQKRIEETTVQLSGSTNAILAFIQALNGFQDGFHMLFSQFGTLYHIIEEQNRNICQMDTVFENLNHRIDEMMEYSESNQSSVTSISDAMRVYQENMRIVVNNNQRIQQMSVSMLDLAKQ